MRCVVWHYSLPRVVIALFDWCVTTRLFDLRHDSLTCVWWYDSLTCVWWYDSLTRVPTGFFDLRVITWLFLWLVAWLVDMCVVILLVYTCSNRILWLVSDNTTLWLVAWLIGKFSKSTSHTCQWVVDKVCGDTCCLLTSVWWYYWLVQQVTLVNKSH